MHLRRLSLIKMLPVDEELINNILNIRRLTRAQKDIDNMRAKLNRRYNMLWPIQSTTAIGQLIMKHHPHTMLWRILLLLFATSNVLMVAHCIYAFIWLTLSKQSLERDLE